MATQTDGFPAWLSQAHLREDRLSAEQLGLLGGAFAFRERCGHDYYSTRLLSHFLLHANSGLKVAQVARLLRLSRPTASRQQGLSSKEALQAALHRMAGRATGKLLPRYAGPIAEFLLTHADATRYDVLDFIQRTWGVRVSRVALFHFLKKYGLNQVAAATTVAVPPAVAAAIATTAADPPIAPEATPPPRVLVVSSGQPVPQPAPPFC
jgi:transposase